jgi:hypothetical protein
LVNGVDYTATNGTTVVLTDALTVGQIVEIDNYLTAFLPTNALRTITTFTATAAQTTFSVTYTQGLIDVFYNGSNLAQSEYTATNGTSIVLATACQVNDIVVVYAYSYAVGAYSGIGGSGTINTIPKFTASSVIGNSLIFDNGTSVGINTASPTGQASNNTALQIVGAGTGNRAQIKLTNSVSGATGTDGLMLSYDDQLDGYLYNFENGGLIFGTNNAVRLTIASTGSVGIGTTPPTTSTFPHLFSGRNFVTFSGSSNDVYIGSNFYYNGGFLARYSEPSIMINSSNGDIIFGNSSSGTAGAALSVTEKMRITSGGRVGIGQTTPGIALSVAGQSEAWQFGVTTATGTAGALIGSPSANVLAFGDWSGSEKARILPDGQFCMNTTTALTAGWLCISVNSNNYNAIVLRDTGTTYSAGNYYQVFTNSSNTISGSISHPTATTVSFNTSSDYRLKEDLKDFNGLDILSNIKFYDFKWKDEDKRMHGVIAHELETLLPLAVSGTKDAIDEDGNIVSQGVDYSKLVPILGKAIQELKAEIEQLKQK